MEVRPRKIRNYLTADGREPFESWFSALRDTKGQTVIDVRLHRVALGNFGDHKPVGEGVYELVIDFGPGYRVYFGLDGDDVILLGGGDKSTQSADIQRAKDRWSDYNA